MHDPRLDRLAEVLVHYSIAVRRGQVVSLTGPPLAEPLLTALYREVLRAGGHPFILMAPEACEELLFQHGNASQQTFVHPLERCEVETADAIIHVVAPLNSRGKNGIDASKQAARIHARRPLMDRFLERSTKGAMQWVATLLPTHAAAQDAGMSLADFADLVFGVGLLDRPDPVAAWRAQSERQARCIALLAGHAELRIRTPHGTDLRLGVSGRTWINGDGRSNFPDGEIFTAPIEDATEGTATIDMPAVHGGCEVVGARLVFRAGKVVDATASQGEAHLIRALDQDAGARVLGEVALGCNYALTRPTRSALLDEKIGGTFHVALGASYPICGGVNRSALHWDLVGDLRRGGRVEIDGKLVSENGRFVEM